MLRTDKSAFYYVPRTGSVWTSEMIQANIKAVDITETPGQVKDEDYDKYLFGLFNRHTAPKDSKLLSFCFVRHPIGWYESFWRAVKGRTRGVDKRFTLADCWSESFDEFVSNSVDKFPNGFLTQMYGYFMGVDFVGRQENLREDLIKALTLAGEDFDADMIRTHPAINTEKYNEGELSDKITDKLLKSEEWVIKMFYDSSI